MRASDECWPSSQGEAEGVSSSASNSSRRSEVTLTAAQLVQQRGLRSRLNLGLNPAASLRRTNTVAWESRACVEGSASFVETGASGGSLATSTVTAFGCRSEWSGKKCLLEHDETPNAEI